MKKQPLSNLKEKKGAVSIEDKFSAVKNRLSVQEVIRFYGFEISHSGMMCCPFHDDRTPSMKIYPDNYYCFGCGESGDAINFVAKLFDCSQFDALKKIDADFGLRLFDKNLAVPIQMRVNPEREYQMWLRSAEQSVSRYLNELGKWRVSLKPKNETEQLNPRFVESLHETAYAEYLYEKLRYGSKEEKKDMYLNCKKEIENIELRLKKLDRENAPVKRKAI